MAQVNKKIKQAKMTLDKLALLTQQGFMGVDKRFDGVDKRFDGVDKRFDGVDKRFDRVENRLDRVENEIREMKENSSELFTKLDKFIALYEKQEQEMLLFGAQIRRLEERVIKLESQQK